MATVGCGPCFIVLSTCHVAIALLSRMPCSSITASSDHLVASSSDNDSKGSSFACAVSRQRHYSILSVSATYRSVCS